MTTLDPRPAPTTTARLLAGAHPGGAVGLAEHRDLHGAPAPLDRAALEALCRETGLRGRGGAGFPVATKLAATPGGRRTHVVVNGSESEPASHKDRTLMRHAPHLVLDGVAVVARALGTDRTSLVVHDPAAAHAIRAALAERSDLSLRVELTPASFVAGEARSVTSTLSGGAAVPGGRRVLPSESGVDGRPTFLSNAETFAAIGLHACRGRVPSDGAEDGTTLATLWGDVDRVGVLEIVHGTPLDDLTARPGRPVLVGGYHGTWVRSDGLTVDRDALRAAGATWGAGVVAVLPEATCPLGEVARVAHWLAQQSARQCGPCTFGLPAIAADLDALVQGDVTAAERLTRRTATVRGRGACAHPDGATRFVDTALAVLHDDLALHRHGGCGRPVLGVLPVPHPEEGHR
ncbi:MAG: proton-conducting membrane transporter [Aeromicrobium erythreum]